MKHLVRRKEEDQMLHCPRCGSLDLDIKDVMRPVDIECTECHLKFKLVEFLEWEDDSTQKYRPRR